LNNQSLNPPLLQAAKRYVPFYQIRKFLNKYASITMTIIAPNTISPMVFQTSAHWIVNSICVVPQEEKTAHNSTLAKAKANRLIENLCFI
jgi:hypothetical protein